MVKSIVKRLLAVAVLAAFPIGGASAADMVLKAKAPPAPLLTWNGFYVGGHLGYVWTSPEINAADTAAMVATYGATPKPEGVYGGIHGGYNYQMANRWVLGIEGSVEGFGIKGVSDTVGLPGTSLHAWSDWSGSVVGRVGYGADAWMPYALAGVMWATGKAEWVSGAPGTASVTHVGWTAGFGAEYRLYPQWSVRAEYRYFDLSNEQYGLRSVGTTGSIVTAGASYYFGR